MEWESWRHCSPSCFSLLFHWRLQAGKAGGGMGCVHLSCFWASSGGSASLHQRTVKGFSPMLQVCQWSSFLPLQGTFSLFPLTSQLWSCPLLAQAAAPGWSGGSVHLWRKKKKIYIYVWQAEFILFLWFSELSWLREVCLQAGEPVQRGRRSRKQGGLPF